MFTPIKNTKVYEQVMEQIKDMILNGTLKKGDKLPSERDLAEQLGISRASLREAIRCLEIIGLIESRQGEGNFIRSSFQNTFFDPIAIMYVLNECQLKEVFQLRRVLETEIAIDAAKKVRDDELDYMKKLLDKMKTSEDEDERVKLDIKFHYKIAEASRNNLILNILYSVSTIIDSFIKDARKIIINNKHKDDIDFQHMEIWKALKEHNPDKAEEAMKTHMELIRVNLIEEAE